MQSRRTAPPQGRLLRSRAQLVLAVAIFSLLGLAHALQPNEREELDRPSEEFADHSSKQIVERLDDLKEECAQTREHVAEISMVTTLSVETMLKDLSATKRQVAALEHRVAAQELESKRAAAEAEECRDTRRAAENSLEEARRQARHEALKNTSREEEARKELERQREVDARTGQAAKVVAAERKAAAQEEAAERAAAEKADAKKHADEAAAAQRKADESAAAQKKAQQKELFQTTLPAPPARVVEGERQEKKRFSENEEKEKERNYRYKGDMTRCDMVTGMVFSLPHVGVPLLIGGSLLFGDLSAGCEYLESKYGY
ncbi:hypothetical protein T484DRAFT_1892890 [Baffinella frigidus]|nr:hypothetical protein T484DRAFT_1892890 [Cryptophyta sp. CCMP2293]